MKNGILISVSEDHLPIVRVFRSEYFVERRENAETWVRRFVTIAYAQFVHFISVDSMFPVEIKHRTITYRYIESRRFDGPSTESITVHVVPMHRRSIGPS